MAPARMLGVRKGGLGVRVSLLGKEAMVLLYRVGALPLAGARHAACARWARKRKKAWWQRGRREDEINQDARAWRENSRFLARCKGAGCEETLPICADCVQFAIVLDSRNH